MNSKAPRNTRSLDSRTLRSGIPSHGTLVLVEKLRVQGALRPPTGAYTRASRSSYPTTPASMKEREDQTLHLLQQWHEGDRRALDDLLVRDLGFVEVQVRKRLGDDLRLQGDTVDFVQEAVVEVLEYGPRFVVANRAQFRALLTKIVANMLVDQHRRAHAKQRRPSGIRRAPRDSVLVIDPSVRSVTQPGSAAARREEEAWVHLGLQLLDAESRDIVEARQFEERSFAEIGKDLGVSPDAARMKFNRAVRRLGRTVRQLQAGKLDSLLEASGKQEAPEHRQESDGA